MNLLVAGNKFNLVSQRIAVKSTSRHIFFYYGQLDISVNDVLGRFLIVLGRF